MQWDEDGELCIWLTWIDDCIVIGNANVVARESAKLMSLCDCEDVGLVELYDGIYEKALVGAGIGGGFVHSSELNVKNYNKAMKSADMDELSKWIKGMDEEHARFLFNEVWTAVLKENYKDVMPITMTWALKLKANGVVRARCNERGSEQIPNVHYDPNSKSSPVTTQTAIFIAFTILMMNKCYVTRVIDVKGAFLKGKLRQKKKN
jgi:Reverse transcriptase (RNA-dependent DNA polymerase)